MLLCWVQIPTVSITDYRRLTMNSLKDIKDECKDCGEIFTCELCKQGHGIKQERSNVSKMIGCQIDHRKKRKSQCQN